MSQNGLKKLLQNGLKNFLQNKETHQRWGGHFFCPKKFFFSSFFGSLVCTRYLRSRSP